MIIFILSTLPLFALGATWLFLTDPKIGPEIYLFSLALWSIFCIPPIISDRNKKKKKK